MKVIFSCVSLALLLGAVVSSAASGGEYSFFHEDVLGTSFELKVNAATPSTAEFAESVALRETDRLNLVFSNYEPESEFSRFVAAAVGESVPVSAELADALARSEKWTAASGGAFNPAAELFTQLWSRAAEDGVVPDRAELAAAVERVRGPHWELDAASGRAKRASDVPLTLNAITKGIVLDRVVEKVLRSSDEVKGVMLNIGGDIRVAGEMPTLVSIADPGADAVGAAPAASLTVEGGAVATSGGSERGWVIGGRRYSHIIDPRTGMPVSGVASATVTAAEAGAADALATIVSVLPVVEGLRLVNSTPGAECRIQTASGEVVASKGWPKGADTGGGAIRPEMEVEFEIARPSSGRRYRRPYVAVWIEDDDGFPVRTLCLFLMQRNPGPRWYRDLRRWYSGDQMRRMVDDRDLIGTISKPTRNPGKYRVVWDGADDGGKPVPAGGYTLLIEAAREHGSYQLMKHRFDLSEPFEKDLRPNREISAARVRYNVERRAP